MPKKETIKPARPCHNCGGREFWLRTSWGTPEWLCSRCHPEPPDGTEHWKHEIEEGKLK